MTYIFRVEVQDRNGDGDWEVWEFEREGDDLKEVAERLDVELRERHDLNDHCILSAEDENGKYLAV